MTDVCVIGAGPAGLMAAEVAADAGLSVLVADAKPSFGRKFLMAGKSGLNLTMDEPFDRFSAAYDDAEHWLRPMLIEFGNADVQNWAKELDQDVFTGSSGRVFPKVMKASPLLRTWLRRLADKGVRFETRWCWTGWDGDDLCFQAPDGPRSIASSTSILALGGASWSKLGSDGNWADILLRQEVKLAPFKPANMGFIVPWSEYMAPHFGVPIKTVQMTAGQTSVRGDFIISSKGIEGSGIYAVTRIMDKPRAYCLF